MYSQLLHNNDDVCSHVQSVFHQTYCETMKERLECNETAVLSTVWDGCCLVFIIIFVCMMMWSHLALKHKAGKALFVFLYITLPPSHMIWLTFPHIMIFDMWFYGQTGIKPHFPFSGFTTQTYDFANLLIYRSDNILHKATGRNEFRHHHLHLFVSHFGKKKSIYIHVWQRNLPTSLEVYSMQSVSFPVSLSMSRSEPRHEVWIFHLVLGVEFWMHPFWQSVVSGVSERI